MPGLGDVLALIRSGEATTRGEIVQQTGLSRVTVSQRVRTLLDLDYVREAGSATSSGGRRAGRLEFNASRSLVLSVAVETTHVRLAATDLAGSLLSVTDVPVAVTDGPEAVMQVIAGRAAAVLAEAGGGLESVGAIGIALPAPVDPATGRPSQPPMLPGWDAYPVAEHLADSLGVATVVVENDANAMALGEQSLLYPDCPALCFVKVSTGIGTGIVLEGKVYRGVDGGAGDIGHVQLAHSDAPCRCGRHGCLAAEASGGAIAHALSERGVPAQSGRDVAALLATGDPTAVRLTQEAGRRLGEVMATVVCLVNPAVLIVGGALASAPLISGIRERLYPLSLPRATRHLDVRLSALGERAVLQGMTRLVVDQLFSPAAVDRAVDGRG